MPIYFDKDYIIRFQGMRVSGTFTFNMGIAGEYPTLYVPFGHVLPTIIFVICSLCSNWILIISLGNGRKTIPNNFKYA